jgi:hypothetical protein
MATFKVGDWVEITPNPDLRWTLWDPRVHNHFCGRIGKILNIGPTPDDDGEFYCDVAVTFESGIFSKAGAFKALFKLGHLIPSSKYDCDIKKHYAEKAKELHEWEEFKKNSRDEMLKYIFGYPSEYDDEEFDYPATDGYEDDENNIFDEPTLELPLWGFGGAPVNSKKTINSNKLNSSKKIKKISGAKTQVNVAGSSGLLDLTDEELEQIAEMMGNLEDPDEKDLDIIFSD